MVPVLSTSPVAWYDYNLSKHKDSSHWVTANPRVIVEYLSLRLIHKRSGALKATQISYVIY